MKLSGDVDPSKIVVTPTGKLIVTCMESHGLYLVEPDTGQTQLLAGGGVESMDEGPALSVKFEGLIGLALVEQECAVYACESTNHRIRRITLPPVLFGKAGTCV